MRCTALGTLTPSSLLPVTSLPRVLPPGQYPCQPNPKGCQPGTSEGSACCPGEFSPFPVPKGLTGPLNPPGPNEQGIVTNPPTKRRPQECPDKMFCHKDLWTPANETLQNTCFLRELKDCGTFGKACCKKKNPKPHPLTRDDGYHYEVWTCGADAGSGGPYGWCEQSRNGSCGLCTACPPKGQKINNTWFDVWGDNCRT